MASRKAPPKNAVEAFKPLLGLTVWAARKGVGTFLTMEFGEPHLRVREPINPRRRTTAKVKASLRRRRVFPTGDWHLWIQYADWKVTTWSGSVASKPLFGKKLGKCLGELDGQKLVRVVERKRPRSVELHFDLGAVVEIYDSNELEDDRWSLFAWDGRIIARTADGAIAVEESATTAIP